MGKLTTRLEREPTKEELADHLEITVEDLELFYNIDADTVSLFDTEFDDEDGTAVTLEEKIRGEEFPEDQILAKVTVEKLMKAASLSEREIEVLTRTFYHNETGANIATDLGVSIQRISQIKAVALAKMRES
jgi:RNA polymerase sigma factor for flagellar operon FliA